MRKRIILSIILLISILALPIMVFAITSTLTLSGEGAETQGTYVGGAATFANLNSDDDNTSYIRWNTAGTFYHCWEATDLGVTGTINSVKVYFKAYGAVAIPYFEYFSYGQITPYARIAGTNYYGTASGLTSSYATYSYTWNTSPATGIAWTAAEINAMQVGTKAIVTSGGGLTHDIHESYLYIVVDYNATVPTVDTNSALNIIYQGGVHKAHLSGDVTNTMGLTIDYYGFVYNTTSMADPGNVAPSASGHSNWTSSVGDYDTDEFQHQITGLTKGQTYYFRAAAHNSIGWAYGDAVSFTALNDSTVITSAASVVSATTARLNSVLNNNGGQDCTIEFAYAATSLGPFANYAAITAAGTTATPTGNYTTGETPYSDITGLTVSTEYTFCVSATNTVSTQYGAQLTFTTESGVDHPTSFKGIAGSTTISLVWVKGTGSTYTIIRYKIGSYPTSPTDGTSVYNLNMNSVLLSGLTIGTTYYFRAWGLSGTTYSTGNATLMVTTLAAVNAPTSFTTQDTPSYWFQAPDYTNMSAFFMYDLINWGADSFEIQRSILWFLIAITFAVIIGIITYGLSNNLVITVIGIALVMVVGVFAKLISGWLLLPYVIIALTAILVGERR